MEKNRKECQKSNATIVFADEAGIQMTPNLRRTWAPCGQTPVIHHVTRSYRKVSAMGAIAVTPHGRKSRIFFRLLENRNFNTDSCIAFIEQLKQNIRGRICLVWDRFLAHRSKKMLKYLDKQRRIQVQYLPAYAPELNPVEFMWSHLKQNKMSNRSCLDLNELFKNTKAGLCGIRKERDLAKSFIRHTALSKAMYC